MLPVFVTRGNAATGSSSTNADATDERRRYDNIMFEKEDDTQRFALSAVAIAALLGLAACADMTRQDKNTAIGAGVGAVGGAVLTGGSTAGTLGGAAVGGVIGHEVDPRSERGERDPGSLARAVNQEANMRKLSGSTSSAVVMTAQ